MIEKVLEIFRQTDPQTSVIFGRNCYLYTVGRFGENVHKGLHVSHLVKHTAKVGPGGGG